MSLITSAPWTKINKFAHFAEVKEKVSSKFAMPYGSLSINTIFQTVFQGVNG